VLDEDDHGFTRALLLLLLNRDPLVGFDTSDLLFNGCAGGTGGALIAHGSAIEAGFKEDNGGKKSSLSESLTGFLLFISEAHGSLVKPADGSPRSTS